MTEDREAQQARLLAAAKAPYLARMGGARLPQEQSTNTGRAVPPPAHQPTDRVEHTPPPPKSKPEPPIVNRATPRDTAKVIVSRYAVEGVSRLRFQGGTFWLWEGGAYGRVSDDEIRKVVGDFLYGAIGKDRERFDPKKRDIDEVLDALRMEATLEKRFAAPCWLPSAEPAGDWIVFCNGIVNAGSGEFRSHTHRLWSHGGLSFDWDSEAKCPVWERFTESVWPSDPDARNCLEEFIGLCMTLDTWPHKGMLLLGQRRSGKSTIVHVLEKLVGREGFGAFSFDKWLKGEFSAHGLIGKRAAVFSDVRLKQGRYWGKQWDAGGLSHEGREMLLKITGGDTFSFRKMYSTGMEWEGILSAKVVIVSNEPPNFNDDILSTRFLKLHFEIDQEKAGQLDPMLGEKLAAELPGIAARCLARYRRLCERGHFLQPQSGLELDRQLARARSPLLAMTIECLEVSEAKDEWVERSRAHKACQAWLRENGHRIMADFLRAEDMGKHLTAAFDHLKALTPREQFKQGTDGKRRWVGLRLSAEGRRLLEED